MNATAKKIPAGQGSIHCPTGILPCCPMGDVESQLGRRLVNPSRARLSVPSSEARRLLIPFSSFDRIYRGTGDLSILGLLRVRPLCGIECIQVRGGVCADRFVQTFCPPRSLFLRAPDCTLDKPEQRARDPASGDSSDSRRSPRAVHSCPDRRRNVHAGRVRGESSTEDRAFLSRKPAAPGCSEEAVCGSGPL